MTIGVTMGMIAGFFRGWVDTGIARVIDVLLAFPVLLLGLGLASACSTKDGCLGGAIEPGLTVVITIIVISNWPYVARIIRGQVLSLREKEFVEASQLARRLQPADHLPRDPAQPRRADHRLHDAVHPGQHPARGVAVVPRRRRPAAAGVVGRDALGCVAIFDSAWWYMLFPGMALLLTVLAFNLVGDGMQDALNPKSSKSR